MSNWYVEVRHDRKANYKPHVERGGKVTVRYNYEQLVQHRLNNALEDAKEQGIKVTDAMKERWLKTIQTEVTAFLMRKGQV